MKSILKYTIFTMTLGVVTLSLTACGGGSSSSFSDAENKIQIDVNCTTPATIATYISLESGDTIVQSESNTSIKTYHDSNGQKKVCLESGSAYILRK